jgi:TIGR03009 family protein
MRVFGLVLAALLAAAAPADAQQNPAPPAAPAQPPQALDNYLLRWEQEMQKVQTLQAQLARIDRDKTFNTVTKLDGYAAYRKAGTGPTALNLAMLEMRPEGKQEVQEKYICTGTFLYQFSPASKEIKVFELPKPKPGQVAEDNFLSFMFGMKAEEARRRYEMTLAKEDQYYIFVDILPRFPNDRADFKRARMVLNKSNFLPRRLWFEQPNGSETTWDIPRIQSGAELDRRLFDPPQTPPGWRMVNVPKQAETQPRVVRPGAP